MNRIIVNHGDKEKLVKQFNTSYPTVRKALEGNLKKPLGLKIRKAALEEFEGWEEKENN